MKPVCSGMNDRALTGACRQSQGHTLLEVLVALLITAMVITALASSLSFSMRFLYKEQERPPDLLQGRLATMDDQLASFYEAYENCAFFEGDSASLAFSTSRSVQSLHKGAPVVARYVFVESAGEQGMLYYAETPCEGFRDLAPEEFLTRSPQDAEPADEDEGPVFHGVPAQEFAIAYFDTLDGTEKEDWDGHPLPEIIVISSKAYEDAPERVKAMAPGFLKMGTGQ